MATKTKKKKPSPDELLAEVKGQKPAKTYEFDDYLEVVHELQAKNYSYAKIAEFLSERLGYQIARGQVYRAYQSWMELQEHLRQEEAEAERYAELADQEFDPEESDAQRAHTAISNAAGTLLQYSVEKFPDGTLPCERVDLFKFIVALLDEKTRDDFEAEQADKRMEQAKGSTNAAKEAQ